MLHRRLRWTLPVGLLLQAHAPTPVAAQRLVPVDPAAAVRAAGAVRRRPGRGHAEVAAFRVPRAHRRVGRPLRVPEDDRAFATRLARYCARNPVALEQLTYDRAAKAVTYRSDTSEGPTAGTETADPLEFPARVLMHLPDQGHVTRRYAGWYANRPSSLQWTRWRARPATARCASSPASPGHRGSTRSSPTAGPLRTAPTPRHHAGISRRSSAGAVTSLGCRSRYTTSNSGGIRTSRWCE